MSIKIEKLKVASKLMQPGLKVVADISTRHMSREDEHILDNNPEAPFLIGKFSFGFWMETFPNEPENIEEAEAAGLSKALIKLLIALNDQEIYYVCFDCDGWCLDGFETFDW